MLVTVGDTIYKLIFRHEQYAEEERLPPWTKTCGKPWYPSPKGSTTCEICVGPFTTLKGKPRKKLHMVTTGTALCHPRDQFSRREGEIGRAHV